MKHTSVYQNTAFVTALSVAERALGFLYRIALARLIGAEGVGIYQIALSHFFTFRTLGGGGLPVTLSRIVSKNNAENCMRDNPSALLATSLLSLFVTLPLSLFFLFFAKQTLYAGNSESASVLQILLLGLSVACVYAVVKGYFWGNKRFVAPAVLEIVEEIIGVVCGMLLLFSAPNLSPVDGAKRAAFATTLSCVLSFIIALFVLRKEKQRRARPREFFKPVLFSAAPITAVRVGTALLNSAVATLFPFMLMKAGMTESEALTAYGVVSGMVMPLLAMPMTIIGSLSIVLVPELSADYHGNNPLRLQKNVARALSFTFLIGAILTPFFLAFGKSFGLLAYGNALSGELLSFGCAVLLPMSVTAISTSMLNSLGLEKQSFLFSAIGAGVFMLCLVFLPAKVGAHAYLIGMVLQFLLISSCSLALLFRKIPVPKGFFLRALLCVALIFPVSLFATWTLSIATRFLGEIFAPVLSAALTLAFSFGAYKVCGFFTKGAFEKVF